MKRWLPVVLVLAGCGGASAVPATSPAVSPAPSVVRLALTPDDRFQVRLGCVSVEGAAQIVQQYGDTSADTTRSLIVKGAQAFRRTSDPTVKQMAERLDGANDPATWQPVLEDAARFCVVNR